MKYFFIKKYANSLSKLLELQVIHGYLTRAGEKQVEEFMQKQSFQLLGVQLHHYPTHSEQIEEVVSFIVGKPYTFEMRLEMRNLIGITCD